MKEPTGNDDYLTIDDLTAELGRSRATVWKLITQHGLTTYRIPPSRKTYVRRADLPTLRRPVGHGQPVPITTKRGGYRGRQRIGEA